MVIEKLRGEICGTGKAYERTTIALDSLGCKLNQAEAELLARQLADAGYRLVSPADEADIYILNTCTVTHIADSKSRRRLRLAHHRNPDALLVATGCSAEHAPQKLAQIEGVDIVLGNSEKARLPQLLKESGHLPVHARIHQYSANRHNNGFRTRAFIKVQDGCDNLCAYCIVPLVRGRDKSLPADQIVTEIRHRVDDGYKEVVLTGTKIGSYSHNGTELSGLLERVLTETDVTRLRLSSLQPQEISPDLVQLWGNKRLCRHFHLALQSGSNEVLSRMKRRYSVGDYRRSVSLIHDLAPEAAITTDIIVGFPGETDEEFEKSYNLCREMEFARIHIFPYSPRRETRAAQMPQTVKDTVKKQRSQQMLALAKKSARDFSQRFSGKTMPVLWEKRTNGVWSGLTDNYIKVYTQRSGDLSNKLLLARLAEVRDDGVWGELVSSTSIIRIEGNLQ